MKKSFFTLILSLFLIFLTIEANAQGDITVRLKMSPPGKLNITDFYAVTLTNNTGSEQSVYLVGTATEEKDGLIARGTTVPFKLKTGTTILQIKDLPKTPDVEYLAKDPRYKNSLIRKGEFPAGEYEVCVYVKYSKNKEDAGSDCFTQTVLETGILSLINPSDGQEIDLKTPLMFTWMYSGKMPSEGYTLKIVEVKKDQTPEGAMKSNRAVFEKERIKSTTFSYPSSAQKFEKGKKYAWQIKSGATLSEIFTLGILEPQTKQQTGPAMISLIPTGNCCYQMYVWQGTGGYFSSFKFMSSKIASAIAEPDYSIINKYLPTDFVLKTTGGPFPVGNNSFVGTVCFNFSAIPIPITIGWSTDNGTTWTNRFDTTIICEASTGCMVQNPSFETVITPPDLSTTNLNPITATNVPGWVALFSSPDICPSQINWGGTQAAFHGTHYAGLSAGGGQTEALGGTLAPQTTANSWYNVHARFSQAEIRTPPGVWIEIYLRDAATTYHNTISATWGQRVGGMLVNDFENWQLFSVDLVTTGVYNQILIRGDMNATPPHYLGYVFIDSVDVCEIEPPPTGCMVQNPSFETVITPPDLSTTNLNPITATNVPGWVALFSSPDICPSQINWGGTQAAFHGTHYAGLSAGGGQTEALGGTLAPQTTANSWYNVHARFSQAEIRTPPGVWIEIYLRDAATTYHNTISATWGQRVGGMLVNDFENWQLFSVDLVTTGVYNQILIRGDMNATPPHYLGYVFIDSVDVCPITNPCFCRVPLVPDNTTITAYPGAQNEQTYNLQCNSSYTLTHSIPIPTAIHIEEWGCSGPSCQLSYYWQIVKPNSTYDDGVTQNFSYSFASYGTYIFQYEVKCGTKTCIICKDTITIDSITTDTCSCQEPEPFDNTTITAYPNSPNPHIYNLQCNSSYTYKETKPEPLGIATSIHIEDWGCVPDPPCQNTYSWSIKVPGSSTSTAYHTQDFTYTFNDYGTYTFHYDIWCGHEKCRSCTNTITIEQESCECGEWKKQYPIEVLMKDQTTKQYSCKSIHEINIIDESILAIKVSGYKCIPDVPSCKPDYTWIIKDMIGTPLQSGIGNVIKKKDITVTLPKNFRVIFYPVCGVKQCDPCILDVKIEI